MRKIHDVLFRDVLNGETVRSGSIPNIVGTKIARKVVSEVLYPGKGIISGEANVVCSSCYVFLDDPHLVGVER